MGVYLPPVDGMHMAGPSSVPAQSPSPKNTARLLARIKVLEEEARGHDKRFAVVRKRVQDEMCKTASAEARADAAARETAKWEERAVASEAAREVLDTEMAGLHATLAAMRGEVAAERRKLEVAAQQLEVARRERSALSVTVADMKAACSDTVVSMKTQLKERAGEERVRMEAFAKEYDALLAKQRLSHQALQAENELLSRRLTAAQDAGERCRLQLVDSQAAHAHDLERLMGEVEAARGQSRMLDIMPSRGEETEDQLCRLHEGVRDFAKKCRELEQKLKEKELHYAMTMQQVVETFQMERRIWESKMKRLQAEKQLETSR